MIIVNSVGDRQALSPSSSVDLISGALGREGKKETGAGRGKDGVGMGGWGKVSSFRENIGSSSILLKKAYIINMSII